MPENGVEIKEQPKKRGRKPSNPDRKEIVEKLKNIAKQDIGEFIRVPSKGQLSGAQIHLVQPLDKFNSDPTPKEVLDCVKSVSYIISDSGHVVPQIILHDPLEAIRLLKELGEI